VKFASFTLFGIAGLQVLSCCAVFVVPLRLEIISGAAVLIGLGLVGLALGTLGWFARFHPLLALGGGLLLDAAVTLLDFLDEERVAAPILTVRAVVAALLLAGAIGVCWSDAGARRKRKAQQRDHHTSEVVHGREDQHPDADEAAHRRQGGGGGDGAYRAGGP